MSPACTVEHSMHHAPVRIAQYERSDHLWTEFIVIIRPPLGGVKGQSSTPRCLTTVEHNASCYRLFSPRAMLRTPWRPQSTNIWTGNSTSLVESALPLRIRSQTTCRARLQWRLLRPARRARLNAVSYT